MTYHQRRYQAPAPGLVVDFERKILSGQGEIVTNQRFESCYYHEAQFRKVTKRFQEVRANPELLARYVSTCYHRILESVRVRRLYASIFEISFTKFECILARRGYEDMV